MTRRLAIAVIHGMGRQKKEDPEATGVFGYSARFRDRVRRALGDARFDAEIAWREVFWADIIQARQDAYEHAMRAVSRVGLLRSFAMHRLGDAANYFPPINPEGSVYDAIHGRIDRALRDLEADVPEGTPLLVAAHSLGGHMMSNYIWDVTRGHRPRPTDFGRFASFRGLLTFGCNIPIFTFACTRIEPLRWPGAGPVPSGAWWRNYYSPHDPLGFPLGILRGGYAEMAARGELEDHAIRVGLPLLERGNPLCHNAYWRDRGFVRATADFVEEIFADG